MMTTTRQWVSRAAACRHLAMSPAAFDQLLADGEIPYRTNPGSGRVRVRIEDLEAYETRVTRRAAKPVVLVRGNAAFA